MQVGSGSMTQWMFACTCSLSMEDGKRDDVDLCMRCGKRIGAGREGSFSQFIFRANLCHCAHPRAKRVQQSAQLFRVEKRHQLLSNLELNFDEDDESNEIELAIDPNTFPLERYKPLAELGRGAAGAVHLCRDRLLKKLVAVKSLHQLAAEQLVFFQMEAKTNSMLSHKNIIRVFDFGATESGCPFMVMQFVNGISLEQFLATYGPLSEPLAARVLAKVCDALSYVHDNEIFHRDLKPSNILLVPQSGPEEIWDVRLIDFGVAALKKDQEPTIVQGKVLVGTPTYMSPDQFLNRTYDSRSEIYSLGCVLFEILTGSPPFIEENALALASMHANQAPPTMAERADTEFSPAMEEIVAKALTKDPDERYQNAQEFRTALLAAADSVDSEASAVIESKKSDPEAVSEPATEVTRVVGTQNRFEKLVIVAIGLLFIIVFFGVSVSLWSNVSSTNVSSKSAPEAKVGPDTLSNEVNSDASSNEVNAERSGDADLEITYSVKDTLCVLKGRWEVKDFKKLALKSQWQKLPPLRLRFLNAVVDWKGLKALSKTKVSEVSLEETPFSRSDVKYLGYLKELEYLLIPRVDLRGQILEPLTTSPKLNNLVIKDGQIDRDGWSKIGLINSLTTIGATGTTGWSGKDIEPIGDLKLISLDLQDTNLGDDGAECLSAIRTLNSLAVNNCRITDTGLKQLSRLTALENFYIVSNDVSNDGLMNLKEMKGLSILKAQNTRVTQAGVDKLNKVLPHLNKEVLGAENFDKLTEHDLRK